MAGLAAVIFGLVCLWAFVTVFDKWNMKGADKPRSEAEKWRRPL